jgi:hypothetical protein
MPRLFMTACLGSLLCVAAAGQKPAPDEQKRTIDAAREIAVHYTNKLPDFICNEQVERSDRAPGNVKIDRLVIQLSYFGQKEKQKLISINGSPTTQTLGSLDGLTTVGS